VPLLDALSRSLPSMPVPAPHLGLLRLHASPTPWTKPNQPSRCSPGISHEGTEEIFPIMCSSRFLPQISTKTKFKLQLEIRIKIDSCCARHSPKIPINRCPTIFNFLKFGREILASALTLPHRLTPSHTRPSRQEALPDHHDAVLHLALDGGPSERATVGVELEEEGLHVA
jgi:hypothetical protein